MAQHQVAFLIPRIIQDDRNRLTGIARCDVGEQETDTLGIDVGFIGEVKISFVTASTAPSTFKRWRPEGDAINNRAKHQTMGR